MRTVVDRPTDGGMTVVIAPFAFAVLVVAAPTAVFATTDPFGVESMTAGDGRARYYRQSCGRGCVVVVAAAAIVGPCCQPASATVLARF